MSGSRVDRTGYALEVDDPFDAMELDRRLWLPYYLPHWSSRSASAARFDVGGGSLRLRIDADQAPWAPGIDGYLRVSSLQTGLFAGPVGSATGQHRFRDDLVVREAQPSLSLYTPRFGLFEVRLRALDDPLNMVALWMIGVEDRPAHSAEICIVEIFGRDVGDGMARIGMGVHPFGDPSITDEFAAEPLAIDVREPHWYAGEWTPDHVAFYVDDEFVKLVRQSPDYPMQFMLGIYEFATGPERAAPRERYPKEFVVEHFRGYRPITGPGARPRAFDPMAR
jgi:Glycosyl hydrolases family 16